MNKRSENIYKIIAVLADLSMQRKLWLNENNNTGLTSSYSELMCSLFDDFSFDNFIEKKATKIALSSSLIWELNRLRDFLNNYKEKGSDEEIVDDPEWKKIVKQSKIVIKKWREWIK